MLTLVGQMKIGHKRSLFRPLLVHLSMAFKIIWQSCSFETFVQVS